jgi:hypothetical protein
MCARMMGNFDLFLAHELRLVGGHAPDIDAFRRGSSALPARRRASKPRAGRRSRSPGTWGSR